jgi:uncharacterized protein (DUF2267 family)
MTPAIGAAVLSRVVPTTCSMEGRHGVDGRPTDPQRGISMSDSGFSSFKTTEDKTNRVLRDVEEAYGWPKERRNQSYAALRAVLHALRDRLPVEEAAQLGAQLPMLVRGIYYEQWDPSKVPMKFNREQFLQRIRQEFPYEIEGDIEQLERTVLQAMRRYITDGEWDDIKAVMPKDLATALP